jgi:hypothetical protein
MFLMNATCFSGRFSQRAARLHSQFLPPARLVLPAHAQSPLFAAALASGSSPKFRRFIFSLSTPKSTSVSGGEPRNNCTPSQALWFFARSYLTGFEKVCYI